MAKGKWILRCLLAGAFFLLFMGTVTLLLWNWLVPELFNGPPINLWQALGLLVLSKILFGWRGRGFGGGRPPWHRRWHRKVADMSPEQRERFRARMREKWCGPAFSTMTGAPEKKEE